LEAATVIGCDIGKLVVHVHGINTDGKMIMRRQPKRRNLLSFFQNQPRLSVSNCVS
jgi:transposase